MASKGKKMQMGFFVRLLNMRCTLIPISPAVAFRKAGNHSTNHQCGAHVLRREDLHFSGLQTCQRTAGTPMNLRGGCGAACVAGVGIGADWRVGLSQRMELLHFFL